MLKIEGDISFLKKGKFTDVCMAGWQELPPSHKNIWKCCKF